MTTWEQEWIEGLEALDAISVSLERHKHNLAVLEQNLDRLELIESRIPQKKGLLSWLINKENN